MGVVLPASYGTHVFSIVYYLYNTNDISVVVGVITISSNTVTLSKLLGSTGYKALTYSGNSFDPYANPSIVLKTYFGVKAITLYICSGAVKVTLNVHNCYTKWTLFPVNYSTSKPLVIIKSLYIIFQSSLINNYVNSKS